MYQPANICQWPSVNNNGAIWLYGAKLSGGGYNNGVCNGGWHQYL